MNENDKKRCAALEHFMREVVLAARGQSKELPPLEPPPGIADFEPFIAEFESFVEALFTTGDHPTLAAWERRR